MNKYYRIIAYTPYAGEELFDYGYGENEFNSELVEKANLLMEECADMWYDQHSCSWAEDGFDSIEEWEEDYFSGCGVRFEEINYATYLEEAFDDEEEWEEEDD